MKILYYDLLREVKGTNSNHINEIINNFIKHGHTVCFYNIKIQNNKNQASGKSTNVWRKIKISKRWPCLGIFISFVAEFLFFLRGIIALNKAGEEPAIVYYRHGLFNPGFWTAKLLKIPAVKEVNGIVANEMQVANLIGCVTLKLINRIESHSMSQADMIIVVTSKLKELLIREYNVPEDKIEILENGANVELFKPMDKNKVKSKLRLEGQFQYVCYVGNFAVWQGLEYLIKSIPDVLKECPGVCFLLVGDGDLKVYLEEIARDIGVFDKVIFTGMVNYREVPYYINASEVCVAPKLPLESGYSPLKLCEYLACEKPVVASRISGFELLEEYQMGLLVPPKDEVALAQAIVKLIKSPFSRKMMGKNGRQYVVENRSWASIAKKLIQVFENLIHHQHHQI